MSRSREERIAELRKSLDAQGLTSPRASLVRVPAVDSSEGASVPGPDETGGDPGSALDVAVREGRQIREVAEILLTDCGFTEVTSDHKPRGLGITLSFSALDSLGGRWAFEVSGALSAGRFGLRRADTLWKSLAFASVLHEGCAASGEEIPLVLLSTDLPVKGSAGYRALSAVTGPGRPVYDAVELLSIGGHERLSEYAACGFERCAT